MFFVSLSVAECDRTEKTIRRNSIVRITQVCPTHGSRYRLCSASRYVGRPEASLIQFHRRTFRNQRCCYYCNWVSTGTWWMNATSAVLLFLESALREQFNQNGDTICYEKWRKCGLFSTTTTTTTTTTKVCFNFFVD